jgi:hypothetical protein
MSIPVDDYNFHMNPEVLDILRGVFFWVMLVGVAGGYISLRIANRNRDRAAFIEFPESPEKFLVRARIAYAVFIVFLLAMIGGLAIVVFQILQISRPVFPGTAAPTQTSIPTPLTPSPTATATIIARTATPVPTSTPTPAETEIPGIASQARVGNTGFEGVNVRSGPGLGNPVIAKLSPGTIVGVFDEPPVEADGYDWQHVWIDETMDGWIAEDFLIPVAPPGP